MKSLNEILVYIDDSLTKVYIDSIFYSADLKRVAFLVIVENENKDWSSFAELISLLLIFPSNYLTYKAALFNMNILKEIKRNKKYVEEKGFNKCMHHSNIVFGCSKWQRLSYSEYLIA